MASLTIAAQSKTLTHKDEIQSFLDKYGIWYRFFEGVSLLPERATNEEILSAFAQPIEELKKSGGYVTADVINVQPDTPGLEAMLNKFNKEHWHDENEVRFIVGGSGIFHINPKDRNVFSIEMFPGDMISVPKGTLHWFDLCKEKTIKAIRLFEDPSGWTPHYTDSGKEESYEPLCFGSTYIP